jgi:hypothetical protein
VSQPARRAYIKKKKEPIAELAAVPRSDGPIEISDDDDDDNHDDLLIEYRSADVDYPSPKAVRMTSSL